VNTAPAMEKQNQNQTLLKLEKQSWKIIQRLVNDPTSQGAVGLVQEMVETTKENIIGTLKSMTMDSIQETFTRLAVKASHTNGKRKRKQKAPGLPSKKQKTMRKSDVAEGSSGQSPMSSSSSMSNVSSDITDSSLSSTIPTPESSKSKLQMVTSTPVYVQESDNEREYYSTKTAIKHLITHFVSRNSWEIWLKGASHNVSCRSVKSLSYLSNLFYGMRCIFSHGMPHKTVEFGAMRVDRTPQKLSDLDISVSRKDKTEEERIETKTLCESYLLDVARNARENFSQMQMDHDLFLTAQSFYAYAVDIIGSVAACIAYKYGDVKLREKAKYADKQEMQEIKKAVDAAWKLADEEIATSPLFQTSPNDMDITAESQPDDSAVPKMSLTGTSTGLTPDFEDFSLQ